MAEKIRDLEHHFSIQIAVAVSMLLVAGCTDFDTHMARCKEHAIGQDRAKIIALKHVGAGDIDGYTIEVSTGDYGYLVYCDAKDES